jgi:hypothetical protein
MKKITRQLTFANVVACIALFVALGGASYAAFKLPKNSVGTRQLKKSAVTSAKVKNGSLLAQDFKAGQLPAGKTGPQGAPGAAGVSGAAGATGTGTGPAATGLPHARVGILSFNEPVINASGTMVSFDTEIEDNAGMADLLAQPGTLVVPRTGLYFVAAELAWQQIKSNGRVGGTIEATKDPAGKEFLPFKSVSAFDLIAEPFVYLFQPMSETVRLTAGQAVSLRVFQQTGMTEELTTEGDGTWLEVTYLGP